MPSPQPWEGSSAAAPQLQGPRAEGPPMPRLNCMSPILHARASPCTPAAALGLKAEVPDKQLSAMSCLQLTKVLANYFLGK